MLHDRSVAAAAALRQEQQFAEFRAILLAIQQSSPPVAPVTAAPAGSPAAPAATVSAAVPVGPAAAEIDPPPSLPSTSGRSTPRRSQSPGAARAQRSQHAHACLSAAQLDQLAAFQSRADYMQWHDRMRPTSSLPPRGAGRDIADHNLLRELQHAYPNGLPDISGHSQQPRPEPPQLQPWLQQMQAQGFQPTTPEERRILQGNLPPSDTSLESRIRQALSHQGSTTNLPPAVITALATNAHTVTYVPHPGERGSADLTIAEQLASVLSRSHVISQRPSLRRDAGSHVPRLSDYPAFQESMMFRASVMSTTTGRAQGHLAFRAIMEYWCLVHSLQQQFDWDMVGQWCLFTDIIWARSNILITTYDQFSWLCVTTSPAPGRSGAAGSTPVAALAPVQPAAPAAPAAAPAAPRRAVTRVLARHSRYTCDACGVRGWTRVSCPRCNTTFPGAAAWLAAFQAGTSNPASIPVREQGSDIPVAANAPGAAAAATARAAAAAARNTGAGATR